MNLLAVSRGLARAVILMSVCVCYVCHHPPQYAASIARRQRQAASGGQNAHNDYEGLLLQKQSQRVAAFREYLVLYEAMVAAET